MADFFVPAEVPQTFAAAPKKAAERSRKNAVGMQERCG